MDIARNRKMSASGSDRLDACGSSHARITEMLDYIDDNGLTGYDAGAAAQRGTAYHDYLEKFPVYSEKHGIGVKYHPYRRLMELAEENGDALAGMDKRFLMGAIEARSEFIDALIDFAIAQSGSQLKQLHVNLDDKRLEDTLGVGDDQAYFSGLSDVQIVVEVANGKRFGGILDYKSGNSHKVAGNKQLRSLVTLLNREQVREFGRGMDDALVTIVDLAVADKSRPMEVTHYNLQALANAEKATNEMIAKNVQSLKLTTAGGEGASEELDEAAEFGDHCRYCAGKAACGVLLAEQEKFNENLGELKERLSLIGDVVPSDKLPSEAVEKLYGEAAGLLKVAPIFERLKDETHDLIEELVAQDKLDGAVTAKQGRSNYKVDSSVTGIADLYEKMQDLIPGVSFDDFIEQTTDINANALKELIAQEQEMSASGVMEVFTGQLEPKGFLSVSQNKPSIRKI